jgi:hypothetical protein
MVGSGSGSASKMKVDLGPDRHEMMPIAQLGWIRIYLGQQILIWSRLDTDPAPRPIHGYHSQTDLIWPEDPFKIRQNL